MAGIAAFSSWCSCFRPGSTSSCCAEHERDGERERASEEEIGRQLRLEIETLRAPQRIEALATERLHLTEPAADQAIVIERVAPAEPPARSVVAQR